MTPDDLRATLLRAIERGPLSERSRRVVLGRFFDERTDEQALAAIAELLPDREVVGVPGREIVLGGGNVHCITQQVPRP